MMKAFAEIRAIHEMRLLVAAALKLALPRAEQETLESFAALLNPAGGWTLGEIESGAARALVANIRRYFPKLREHVQTGPVHIHDDARKMASKGCTRTEVTTRSESCPCARPSPMHCIRRG